MIHRLLPAGSRCVKTLWRPRRRNETFSRSWRVLFSRSMVSSRSSICCSSLAFSLFMWFTLSSSAWRSSISLRFTYNKLDDLKMNIKMPNHLRCPFNWENAWIRLRKFEKSLVNMGLVTSSWCFFSLFSLAMDSSCAAISSWSERMLWSRDCFSFSVLRRDNSRSCILVT